MQRRFLLVCLLICGLSALWGPSAVAFAQHAQQRLVPAQFTARPDSLGFNWDLHQYGHIQHGQNNTFGGAAVLTINGSSFRASSSMMKPDGSEYVISGVAGNVPVTRWVKIDPKNAVARYVEVISNPGPSPLTAQVVLKTSMGRSRLQSVVTESGGHAVAVLGKEDGGIVGYANPAQGNGQLSFLWDVASLRSKVKPAIRNESNHRFYLTYNVTVPPRKTVAILHGLAQRSLATIPDKKGLKALFKPFRSSNWTRDLPRDVRKALVNSGGLSFGGWDAVDALAALEALKVERGAFDILAAGEKTRLRGSATCAGLTIVTGYGDFRAKLEDVAAVVGGGRPNAKHSILLRDGQVFHGDLSLEDMQFTLNSGVLIDLDAESLDRLIMRESPADGRPPPGVFALLETIGGERLALAQGDQHRLAVVTPWGRRQIPWSEIIRLENTPDQLGYRIGVQDGSRLFAYLAADSITVNTLAFGPQTFAPGDIRSIVPATTNPDGQNTVGDLAVPHIALAGENLLIGQVDLQEITFLVSGQPIPVPTAQIRILRNTTDESDGPPTGAAAAVFEAELWDGGRLNGELAERTLPVRGTNSVYQVRARDVLEIHRPTPTVSESQRRTIAQRIRDLGSDEFRQREAASAALLELGHLTKAQINDALGQAPDPEVRRRLEKILADLPD